MAKKNVIKVKQLKSQKVADFDAATILGTLCFYYPQYTLQEARKLPYRHVKLLLKIAMRQRNYDFIMQTQIAVAPHTEKGKGVTDMINFLKGQIDE